MALPPATLPLSLFSVFFGQPFFLFFCVIYILLSLCLCALFYSGVRAQFQANSEQHLAKFLFCFRILFRAPALATWNLAGAPLVPWQLLVYCVLCVCVCVGCVLCACLPKSGLFIYLCFAGTKKPNQTETQ